MRERLLWPVGSETKFGPISSGEHGFYEVSLEGERCLNTYDG